jgi:hypothetical protein
MEIDMHYGTETGSLVNHVLATSATRNPVVGEGATVLHWSDRTACTVTCWDVQKQIVELREDIATCVDFDLQTYEYEPSQFKASYWFKREKNGKWVQVFLNRTTGRWIKSKGMGLILGRREKYRDPSF